MTNDKWVLLVPPEETSCDRCYLEFAPGEKGWYREEPEVEWECQDCHGGQP